MTCDASGTPPEAEAPPPDAGPIDAQLGLLIEHVPAAVAMFDSGMRFVAVSRRCLADWGIADGPSVIGRSIYDVFPDISAERRDLHRRALAGEELSAYRERLELGGELRWVSWTLKPWRGADGTIGGVLLHLDICTDQVKAIEELERSEQRFRATFDNASVGIAHVAPDGSWLRVNARLCEIVGYTSEELRAITFQEITHPDDLEADLSLLAAVAAGEIERYSIDKRYIRKDGSTVWIELTVACVRGDDGSPHYFISTVQDISARKSAEQMLRASEQRLRLILDGTLAFVGVLKPDGTMIEANAPALMAGGMTRDDVVGRKFWDCDWWSHDPAEVARLQAAVAKAATTGEAIRYDAIVRMAGDTRMAIDFMLSPVRDEDGTVRLLVPSGFDITERKRHEENVDLLMREVNHRSKNLLAVIQAVARHTAATGPESFLARFTDRLQSLAAGQDLLIQGDWRAVEIGALIAAQLRHFVEIGSARITVTGSDLAVNPAACQSLGMVLHELATNAVKYGAWSNDGGTVSIEWGVSTAADAPRFWMCWRESGGPPVVPPEGRGFGSTVIGRMVGASMGGVAETSYPATGLVWRIDCPAHRVLEGTFPPTPALAPSPASTKSSASGPCRILVVEDEALIAIELADLLEANGYEVVGPAASAQTAIDLIARAGCDGAMLDVNLGDGTSEPVARRLQDLRIPYIAVSGYARDQLPPAMRDAVLVEKPTAPDALLEEVARTIGKP